ncbi:MAG: lytic transglycosylase domain-containing protein [Sphingorhabdus sp.]
MSSMTKHLYSVSLAAIAGILLTSPAYSQGVVFKSGIGDGAPVTVPQDQFDPSGGNVQAAMQRWRRLSRGGNYSFNEYASFLMTYPGWPGEKAMRRNAEQAINTRSWSPSQVVAFFDRLPPTTNSGRAKYAIALESTGNKQQAIKWGRKAWRTGPLTNDDETQLLSIMSGSLAQADHDMRVDSLLWRGATTAARRTLPYTSASRRPLFSARLAIKNRQADAASKLTAAGNAAMRDAGILAERATQLRRQGSAFTARQLLANRPPLSAVPADAEEWYEVMLKLAREASNDRQYQLAYDIASKIDDAIRPGEKVINQSHGVRDDYTSLAWLAGTVAYNRLNKPREAMGMFERYGNAARSPQTRTKGWYWAGKAAKRAGDSATATAFFEKASAYYDQFYGQLSIEALGRSLPANVGRPQLAGNLDEAGKPVYAAARLAPRLGSWRDQTQFLRAIANSAESEQDFLEAISLSKRLRRPDLAVMAGRNARVEGHSTLIPYGFPTIPVPSGHGQNWTMIHAITRQESQFDRAAVSHAGARGLMQLMPGTARETAGKINMSYRRSALTTDSAYNIRLGSTYIKRMLNYYGGSYPLAVAAYNAGPGNVNKWLRANGDPRTGAIDILTWIERIPIYETKNYVQRVLENAVMYDYFNPDRALIRSPNPLSRYLGKNRPG